MTFSASSRITNGAIVFSTDEFRSKVACMNELVQLKCNPHSRIAVYSASFGRTQYESIQCPQPQGVPEESKSKVKETSFYPSLILFLCLIHTDGLCGDTKQQLFLSVVLFFSNSHRSRFGTRGCPLESYFAASENFWLMQKRGAFLTPPPRFSFFLCCWCRRADKKPATRSTRLSRLLHTLKSMACTHRLRESDGIMKLCSTETQRFNRFSLLPLPRDVWSTLVLRTLFSLCWKFQSRLSVCERGGEKSLLFLLCSQRTQSKFHLELKSMFISFAC